MARINVYINRQLCDFEQIDGLPIELSVSIDKFLEVDSRLSGIRLDGGIQQLVLPATKNNSSILSNFWEFGSSFDATQDIVIEHENGTPIFSGKCRPAEALRSWQHPKQYFLDVFGGNSDPLSELEGVLLSDIDMGSTGTDSSVVTASWAHDFASSGTSVTFAPVMYGSPNNTSNFYLSEEDLRPHISYTHIFEKIFEGHLGYKINSTFYDTEAFRRMHYMFGVGNQWQQSANLAAYTFEYSLNSSGVNPILPNSFTPIPFTTLVTDPSSMWNTTSRTFTAPIDGFYEFEWVYNFTSGAGTVLRRIYTQGNGTHNNQEYQYQPNSGQVSNRIKLAPEFYEAGDKFRITSNVSNTLAEINAGSYIKGYINTTGYMGAEIAIESCLHRKPVKDFLKGVFHQFNLTGRFDIITKQFFFEPRTNYFTSSSYGNSVSTLTRTERDGYYQRPLTSFDDWSEKINPDNIRIKKLYPFGDSLTLGYQQSTDSVSNAILDDKSGEITRIQNDTPVYGVKYNMADISSGNAGQESLNPYFYAMPNLVVTEIQVAAHLAAMMPDGYEFDAPLPTPTFEFNPTCGFYYGLSLRNDWRYEGTDRTLPMMYMQPPVGGDEFVDNQDSITYNNTGSYINTQIGTNKGLVENYYMNYLQCIKHGEFIEVMVNLTPEEVFSEDFTKMKYFLDNYFILLSITNYNPLANQAKINLFRYTYGLTSTEYSTFEGGQNTVYNSFTSK